MAAGPYSFGRFHLDVDRRHLTQEGVPVKLGGKALYTLGEPLPQTLVRHADVHGLVLVTVTATEFVSRFLDARGRELDVFRMSKQ